MKVCKSSCKIETVKGLFWAAGLWPTDQLQAKHDLFNPSKEYCDGSIGNIGQNLTSLKLEAPSLLKLRIETKIKILTVFLKVYLWVTFRFQLLRVTITGKETLFQWTKHWKSIVSSIWSFKSNICCVRVYCHRTWMNTKRYFCILTKFYTKDPAK